MSKRTFGETLAAYMQGNGIKAKELSDRSGVTQSSMFCTGSAFWCLPAHLVSFNAV